MSNTVLFLLILGIVLMNQSCVHEPFPPIDGNPIDTTDNPIDTSVTGIPCDPEVIYFEKDVLPILLTNCAFSGCHNSATAQDDVILDSYKSVMDSDVVRAYRLDNSDLYEAITDNDPDDQMPPPPAQRLSSAQIETISKWILQGAKDEKCDEDMEECNTENVTYSGFIQNTLNNGCRTCHNATTANGNVRLDNYEGVRAAAISGRLYGAISWSSGFQNMPLGGAKLSDCTIDKIKSWIDNGSQNN